MNEHEGTTRQELQERMEGLIVEMMEENQGYRSMVDAEEFTRERLMGALHSGDPERLHEAAAEYEQLNDWYSGLMRFMHETASEIASMWVELEPADE